MSVSLRAWTTALADTLLPGGVSSGQPVRLDCDDAAVAEAGRALGIARGDSVSELVSCLKAEGGVAADRGLSQIARSADGSPPTYLAGLAVLVLAASRMETSEHNTMAAYYVRLAALLDIPLRDSHPGVAGVRELVARFDDLAAWMEYEESGARGLLDLPAGVHPSIVGVPINQSLLRAGDRSTLGSFFDRTSRLIDAGWDPVNQLHQWGGRHQLSTPLQHLLTQPNLHAPLAGALRAARHSWDGSTVDAAGRRLLPGQLALHLPPMLPFALSVTVPALGVNSVEAEGPGGDRIELATETPAGVPLDWLHAAADGPVIVDANEERVRVLDGPTMLFEVTPLGVQAVAAASEDPVWILTCEPDLIHKCPDEVRFNTPLPGGWALLCDVEPELLQDEMRVLSSDAGSLGGIAAIGGLRLGKEVWLLDHPPEITADVLEPAPVTVDGSSHGYIENGQPLTLDTLAHVRGSHRIIVGEQTLAVELVERGPRTGLGSIGFDLDPRRVHAGAHVLRGPEQQTLRGPLTTPSPPAPVELPLIVRYRSAVDVIDLDGTVRALAPPAPGAWLEQVQLPTDGPWEIPEPSRAVWLCVNAANGKFIVARQAVDVPVTGDVLDTVEWYADAERVVDHSDGQASARWQRLLVALEKANVA